MKTRISRYGLMVCLVTFCFLANACNSSEKKPSNTKHIVRIKDMKFQPTELVLNSGDTVVWINEDMVAHDVTGNPGKTWSSGTLAGGESWSMAVSESEDYYCSLHAVMKGKLKVK